MFDDFRFGISWLRDRGEGENGDDDERKSRRGEVGD